MRDAQCSFMRCVWTRLNTLSKGCPILVLEGHCHACFRRFPAPAHLGPVLRIKINMLWITLLPGYTKRNNRNHDKRYHDGSYQLSNSTQISFQSRDVRVHMKGRCLHRISNRKHGQNKSRIFHGGGADNNLTDFVYSSCVKYGYTNISGIQTYNTGKNLRMRCC